MTGKALRTKNRANQLKKLLKKHLAERCDLHQWYKAQTQLIKIERRKTYKNLTDQQERTFLLTVSIQKLNQLKQTHALNYKHLLANQAKEREHLLGCLTDPAELDWRKRTRLARSVIEAAIKSGTLLIGGAIPLTDAFLQQENRSEDFFGTTQ